MEATGRSPYAVTRLLKRSENPGYMLKEQRARAGQPRAACRACKQRHTQFLFQFFDGPRQRRLLNMQSLSSADEVEFFSYRKKTTEVAKFHVSGGRYR